MVITADLLFPRRVSTSWSGLPFSSPTPQFKSINSPALSFLYSPTLTSIHDHWKNHSLDYAEYTMRNAGLEETQAGIKIAGRNIHNLRYADDTTLKAESEEELEL